ncbi:uncharacterized protein [Palaemon carinicauda]|uniref:uncharacterized protein n=1 Tax=Palaemon carinicauda TaxID=392227 RepID=UPI0035B5ACEF
MEIETTDDAARFLSRDSWRSKLFTIKKSELLVVSDYLELDFTLSSTNDDIRKGIIAHLVPDGVDVDFKLLEEEIDEDCEVVKLRLKLDLKKLEFEDEQNRREHELSMKQLENEQQKRDHELELARLTGFQSPISGNEDSRMLKYVPKFDESDVVEFFIAFEKVAANFNWSEDKWAFMAQTAFSGKALKAWASLSLEDSKDYAKVKEAILRIYEMVPEAYRVKFRDSRKSSNQTFVEFAREMEKHFENWLRSSDVNCEYAKLCQLMLLENFKHNLPKDLCIFLDEKKIDNLASAARLADGYVITHNSYSKPAAKGKYNTCETVKLPTGVNVTANDGNQFKSSPPSPQKHFKSKYQGRVTCFCCGKNGHIATKCPKRDSAMLVNNKQEVDDDFKWFKSQGKISTLESWQECHNVNVLRDTGSSQSLILRKAIPVGSNWLNEHKLIKGVGNGWISCPVVELYFFSDIVAREAKFAVVDTLPIPEVDVVLANDLAQGKVNCNPTVFANPQVLVPKPETVLVTTRSGKSTDFEVEHPDLESLFNADSLDHVSNNKSICSEKVMNWNRNDLVRVQNEDIEIKNIKIKLKEGKGVDYEVDNEVLYKVIVHIRKREGNLLKHRVIVVPSKFRNGILRKAHDDLFAGHLGITKTFDRVRKNFYWKGLKRDVKKYCKTCHQCQISGKPNMVIPKASLSPIPSLGEPFEHVVIDVVGPLPRSKVGSEYILTIIDRLTRYPEAIPLKSQKARVIAKHLINYFSRFGLPKTIQSDRGTNFLSKLLLPQFKNFGIEHKPSTPYHSESQGIVERFHQTLKAMIRKMCNEKVGLWEEYLPYLLFAVRSIPNETTNFAPFNLVFAHKVRGPLDLLREVWEGNGPSKVNIADLINDGKGKLYEISSSWSSPIVVVAKENGQSRLCIDYRKVNKATKADSFPIPRVDDCIDKVGNSKFITKIDLLKGYYQVPLSNRAKEVSAFVTADGLYQFEVMPFGMQNAAATFQRLMAMVTRGIKNCVVYIDDIIVYSNDFETHLVILEELLTALSNAAGDVGGVRCTSGGTRNSAVDESGLGRHSNDTRTLLTGEHRSTRKEELRGPARPYKKERLPEIYLPTRLLTGIKAPTAAVNSKTSFEANAPNTSGKSSTEVAAK